MRRIFRPAFLTAPALLLAVSACSNVAELQPAADATAAAGVRQGAVAANHNLRIVAASRDWPGPYRIEREVTPLLLTVRNQGAQPVALRYSDIKLVTAGGARYRALPLYEISGDVNEAVHVRSPSPIGAPGYVGQGYAPAPYYRGIYPGRPVYTGSFFYDRPYYDRFRTYFVNIPLPTERMRIDALPEGVLDPGGEVGGWVYFERLPTDAERVTLHVDIADIATGAKAGELRIPFTVKKS